MAALEAGGGDVGLAALAYAGSAGGPWDEVGLAVSADSSSEVPGEVGPGAHSDPAGEVDVSLGEVGVLGECLLSLLEEDADALLGYPCGPSVGHSGCLFPVFGCGGRVYKRMVVDRFLERGRAARLARGAHNPKVGSSNLPPATISGLVSGSCLQGFSGVHCSV